MGYTQVVQRLIEKGVDIDQKISWDRVADGREKDLYGTPYQIASHYNRQEIADLLIQHGANTEIPSSI